MGVDAGDGAAEGQEKEGPKGQGDDRKEGEEAPRSVGHKGKSLSERFCVTTAMQILKLRPFCVLVLVGLFMVFRQCLQRKRGLWTFQ